MFHRYVCTHVYENLVSLISKKRCRAISGTWNKREDFIKVNVCLRSKDSTHVEAQAALTITMSCEPKLNISQCLFLFKKFGAGKRSDHKNFCASFFFSTKQRSKNSIELKKISTKSSGKSLECGYTKFTK